MMSEKTMLVLVLVCLILTMFLAIAEAGNTVLTCGNEHIQVGSSLGAVMTNCEVTVPPYSMGMLRIKVAQGVWRDCEQHQVHINESGFYGASTPYQFTITCGIVTSIVRTN